MDKKLQYKKLQKINKFDPYFKVESDISQLNDSYDENIHSTAGRLMSIRDFGSTMFLILHNGRNKLQILAKKQVLGQENMHALKTLVSHGDVVGVSGHMCTTNTGDRALQINDFRVLAKNFHDLSLKSDIQNKELCYRKRYLDLLVNPTSYDCFILRSKIISYIRNFLERKDFIEIETPILQHQACGATADTFKTYHDDLNVTLNLRIATELPLKMAIVGNIPKVFEIGRIFRNEGISPRHSPEFTSIEIYESYSNYEKGMILVKNLIHHLNIKLNLAENHLLTQDIKCITLYKAIEDYFQVDEASVNNLEWLLEVAKKHDISTENTKGMLQYLIFDKVVADHLKGMVFVKHYPIESSPLAMPNSMNSRIADRAELFVNGIELCNLYSELTDPDMQRRNMTAQSSDDVVEDYINAMEYGLPPCCGIGIGIDRLVMLYTGTSNIKDIILFPLLKTKNNQ